MVFAKGGRGGGGGGRGGGGRGGEGVEGGGGGGGRGGSPLQTPRFAYAVQASFKSMFFKPIM